MGRRKDEFEKKMKEIRISGSVKLLTCILLKFLFFNLYPPNYIKQIWRKHPKLCNIFSDIIFLVLVFST